MTVGITIKTETGLFANGLGQNAYFLYDVLKNIDSVDEVCLVVFDPSFDSEKLSKAEHLKEYDVVHWHENIDNIDVLITMGVMPSDPDLKYFKDRGNTRVVGFKGGNNLILSTEDLLFEKRWGLRNMDVTKGIAYPDRLGLYDEIWMVPQQEYHNKDYFEITYGCPAIATPFIWSPKFIEKDVEKIKETSPDFKILFDEKEVDQWRVACMEPNTSILKNMMPIIHAMEWAYRQDKELFKKFNITNAIEFLDSPIMITIGKALQMNKDKKLTFDKRWRTPSLLGLFSDMIVSHQWGNPLNYAYLDVVYFGYPLIHNAHLCQDIGYYYSDFNLKEAGDLIVHVARTHKENKDYMSDNRKIISRYTAENRAMVEQYRNLIEGLFDPSKKPTGNYNWETNLIE
jgi:hypothetical protein